MKKPNALIAILGAGKPHDEDEEEVPPSSRPGHEPSATELALAKKMLAADEAEDPKELARCLKAFIYNCMEEGEEEHEESEEAPKSEEY